MRNLDLHGGFQQESKGSAAITCRHCREGTCRCLRGFIYPHLTSSPQDHPSLTSHHSGNIFKPLPPVPQISSFHFSVIWDLHTDAPSVVDVPPPILTRKSTLSTSESSIGATDGNHAGPSANVAERPESPKAIYISTDPYSPWPSPVRRHFMSRSDGSFSYISRYSRPESRSGARAPDPLSRRTSIGTIGCNIPGVRRVRRWTRNVRIFTQRIHTLKTVLRKVHRREPVIPRSPTPRLPRRISARVSRASSITSFVQSRSFRASTSSALSNSLQRWLETRNRLAHEKPSDHVSITISQYEQRGSWISDGWCGMEYIDSHSSTPQSPRKSITSIYAETHMGKYASVSLRAGEEASRRRRRSSDRTMAWLGSEFGTDSLEYR